MDRIGIRELRQNASQYLEKVERGQTVEVTNRGRLVARIVPAKEELTGLAKLEAEGHIYGGSGDLSKLPPPRPRRPGERPLSEIVEELREDRV
jgi:prevent-host-death family protein